MKRLLLIIFLSCFLKSGWAQFSGHYNALNITGTQNTLKSEIPLAEPSVTGSTYLNDNWQNAEIVLKNGYVADVFPVKIEIEQANAEIRYNGEVKYLDLRKVDCIRLIDQAGTKSVIKKASQFTFNDVPLKGIVMIHGGERYSIIKHFYIEFLQANYNVAMDVGAKDHRKIKREKLYLSQDGRLIQVKGPGKKIAGQLGADKKKALAIIKEHRLRLSKETDLIEFVRLMQAGT